ncbi:MAG: metal-dependent transcriptional regulator [Kiritimatiellia bacterium]
MDEAIEKPFELTASLEDYLEAIQALISNESHGHAHTGEIAERLKVKMPSVSYALGVLCKHGYLNYNANYPVTLTEKGEKEAARVVRRHRVLSTFLCEVLQIHSAKSSEIACRMEHVIDEDFLDRLEILSEDVTTARHCEKLRCYLAERYSVLDGGRRADGSLCYTAQNLSED